MNAENLRTASKLWRTGVGIREIAGILGMKPRYVSYIAEKYRSMFPRRKNHADRRAVPVEPSVAEPRTVPVRDGCMKWITVSGASVTLPMISFIECPRGRGKGKA